MSIENYPTLNEHKNVKLPEEERRGACGETNCRALLRDTNENMDKGRDVTFLEDKIQHYEEVSSLQINLYIQGN